MRVCWCGEPLSHLNEPCPKRPAASSGEERGDEREWTLVGPKWVGSDPHDQARRLPDIRPAKSLKDDEHVIVVPKSTLTAERHRAEEAERERDEAMATIARIGSDRVLSMKIALRKAADDFEWIVKHDPESGSAALARQGRNAVDAALATSQEESE